MGHGQALAITGGMDSEVHECKDDWFLKPWISIPLCFFRGLKMIGHVEILQSKSYLGGVYSRSRLSSNPLRFVGMALSL